MKRLFYPVIVLFVVILVAADQAPSKRYTVAFYNVENLFDTIKEPGVMDEEFIPEGPKRWNTQKYRQKLGNVERTLFELSAATKGYPAVIGLAEVENRSVLEDLVSQPKIRKANYQIVHYDSPEARGVDVAMLYRPDQFKYEGSNPIPTVVKGFPGFKTRDILSVWGTIDGQRFCFFVCHWPSRRGGQQASEDKRIGAAQCVRHAADSIMRLRPDVRVVIMGDLNDDPHDKSIATVLGATGDRAKVRPYGLYNPFYELHQKGYGTVSYNDAWNMFDNIIVNEALVNPREGGLGLVRSESSKYHGNVFDRQFLRQQTGQYRNFPFRTYVGNSFQGGYSDHFPVYILLGE